MWIYSIYSLDMTFKKVKLHDMALILCDTEFE